MDGWTGRWIDKCIKDLLELDRDSLTKYAARNDRNREAQAANDSSGRAQRRGWGQTEVQRMARQIMIQTEETADGETAK